MVMFHSYVSLPKGNESSQGIQIEPFDSISPGRSHHKARLDSLSQPIYPIAMPRNIPAVHAPRTPLPRRVSGLHFEERPSASTSSTALARLYPLRARSLRNTMEHHEEQRIIMNHYHLLPIKHQSHQISLSAIHKASKEGVYTPKDVLTRFKLFPCGEHAFQNHANHNILICNIDSQMLSTNPGPPMYIKIKQMERIRLAFDGDPVAGISSSLDALVLLLSTILMGH